MDTNCTGDSDGKGHDHEMKPRFLRISAWAFSEMENKIKLPFWVYDLGLYIM